MLEKDKKEGYTQIMIIRGSESGKRQLKRDVNGGKTNRGIKAEDNKLKTDDARMNNQLCGFKEEGMWAQQ